MKTICQITIDGKTEEYAEGITYLSLAREEQEHYKEPIVLARFNNSILELRDQVFQDGTLEFLTVTDKDGARAYRRSLTMLMQAAAFRTLKGYTIRVYYSVNNGYYCELFQNGKPCVITAEQLKLLEERMRSLQQMDLPIEKISADRNYVSRQLNVWGMPDKAKMIKFHQNKEITVYVLGEYYDFCYGPLVPSTGYLNQFRLKKYQRGFMLIFPEGEQFKVESFQKADKLFGIFDESMRWSEMLGIRTVGFLNEKISQGRVQEIILVQEALMEGKIASIAGQIAAEKKIKFVLIAGPSSSGKTTFSHRLSIQLSAQGMKPHPISMDDFYQDRSHTPLDENGDFDFEAVEALDIQYFNQTLTDLLEGREVEMPTFNFKTGKREYTGRTLQLGPDDVLVIEGIHGLNDRLSQNIPKSAKFKIYISALTQLNLDYHSYLSTTDCRMIRRMVRDARTRNTTARQTIARWASVRRGEERHIFPYQEEADVMFNSSLIYEMAVLKTYAEPLLYGIPNDCPEYSEAQRMLMLLDYFLPVPSESIGHKSILREFIGGSCFNV